MLDYVNIVKIKIKLKLKLFKKEVIKNKSVKELTTNHLMNLI